MRASDINIIRDYYKIVTPIIFEVSKGRLKKWSDPYMGGITWTAMFSPIEALTWEAIRQFGHAPLYPQYPVKNYFIDFGNPVVKVGIECDGKQFHQDKEKDRIRELEILKEGWKIYRVPGSTCIKAPSNDYYNIDLRLHSSRKEILEKFYSTTIDGLIKAIGIRYFGHNMFYRKPNEKSIANKLLRSAEVKDNL